MATIVTPENILETLETKSSQSHQAYLDAISSENNDFAITRQAVLNQGLTGMAIFALENEEKLVPSFFKPQPWLPTVREQITNFVLQKLDEREVLLESVYFNLNPKVQYQLGRIVSSSISPAGIYEAPDFVARVATGLVTAK